MSTELIPFILKARKANLTDLQGIIALLMEDELGSQRETHHALHLTSYQAAFEQIDRCHNQFLMVVEHDNALVGTCHLTLMPSLTFQGSTRLQIEAVRVSAKHRGQAIGQWMIHEGLNWGKEQGATIAQLTTNKTRERALKFYTALGFERTHEGMKLSLK